MDDTTVGDMFLHIKNVLDPDYKPDEEVGVLPYFNVDRNSQQIGICQKRNGICSGVNNEEAEWNRSMSL